MSSTSAPFGLRPAFHPSGLDRAQALANGIASAYSSDILKGQPVKYNPSAGTIIIATVGAAWSGAFAGVEWTDNTGRRRVSNYWPANTAYQTGSCVAYFYNDANIVYEIQSDATIAQTSIGNEYNFSNIAAGSSTTGLSAATLGVSTAVGNGVQGDMRVVDIAPYPDNAWGDSFVIVRVVNARSQFFGQFTAIA
ncbi:hypothetical protein UFOVP125_59 [uncultured Caudovirales phage]|uniref:Uncharacterized protein n=1 Tax=uncultured Caudovirales phage TaxID=2100421 RepID=A0A6J5LJP3_9CAUD|nr:hypothetical protein UFOVP125_59 [uncultured Caudovirales phage]